MKWSHNFKRTCPLCNGKIHWRNRLRLFFATTLTCNRCHTALKLNPIFEWINIYFAAVFTGIILAYLDNPNGHLLSPFIFFCIYPLISICCFSFVESDYLD